MPDPYKIHFGDPVHHGGPLPELAQRIISLTHTDEAGRRYYRTEPYEGWRRLRTPDDYDRLDAVIERWRRLCF